jgi:hypothetical protein
LDYDPFQLDPAGDRKGVRWMGHYPQERVNIEKVASLTSSRSSDWAQVTQPEKGEFRPEHRTPYPVKSKCSMTGTGR